MATVIGMFSFSAMPMAVDIILRAPARVRRLLLAKYMVDS